MERRHPKRENLIYQNQSFRVYHKFCEETKLLELDGCRSEMGASVSDVLVLFCGSMCLTIHSK